jgi:hypothetical protein
VKSSVIGALLAATLFIAPVAHADSVAVPINDPLTDTLQLWTTVANSIASLAQDFALLFEGRQFAAAKASNYQHAPKQLPAAMAASAALGVASVPVSTTPAANDEFAATATTSPQSRSPPADLSPVIYRVVQVPAFDASTFVTRNQFDSAMAALGSSVQQLLAVNQSTHLPQYVAADGNAAIPYAAENNITNLSGVTLTNANLTASEIPALNYFPSTSTISIAYGGTGISDAPTFGQLLLGNGSGGYSLVSTSSLGIAASGGGGGTSNVSTSSQNTWSALQLFAAGASTTQLSVFNGAWFGATGTSSFNGAGQLTLAGLTNSLLSANSSGQVIATTSIGTNLLTGTLAVANGGTGTSTAPVANRLLLSDSNGNWEYVATSSLGISGGGGSGTVGSGAQGQFAFYNAAGTTLTATFSLFISQSGNIGIGTTTPGSIFSVNNILNLTSATSTFYSTGGVNLSGGCFSINGTCVGGSGGAGVSLSAANNWTGLQTLSGGASTTQLTVFNGAWFGGTATSSFDSAGDLTLAGTLTAGTTEINPTLGISAPNVAIDPITSYHAAGTIATTTGSISASSQSLTVASATGWSTGEGIDVAGAGTAGADLITSVSSISGTTFTLAAAAGTSVSNAIVNHDDTAAITAAISAAMSSGTPVHLRAGNYNVTSGFTINSPVTLSGDGPAQTVIWNRSTSATIFTVDYEEYAPGNWPALTNSTSISNFEISQASGVTPTGGGAFNVYAPGGSNYYLRGLKLENIVMNDLWNGVTTGANVNFDTFQNLNMNAFVGNYGIIINSPSPSGANNWIDISLTGADTGLEIINSDTQEFTNLISDQAPVVFNAVTAGNISRVRFIDPKIEDTSGCAVQFGTGASVTQFIGGEIGNTGGGQQTLCGTLSTTEIDGTNLYPGSGNSLGNIIQTNALAIGGTATPDPTTVLDVTGNGDANETGNGSLQFYNDGGVTTGDHEIANFFRFPGGIGNAGFAAEYYANGSTAPYSFLYTPGGSDFAIATYNSGQIFPLYIKAAGNVGIDTSSPYSRLQVTGPDTASTSAFAVVNSASTTVFSVFDNGNSTYSGSIFQSSDQRLKTDVQSLDASSSLSAIELLNPVSYLRLDQPGTGENLGFIAQQVQQVFPQLVSTTSATALTPGGTLTLNYEGLISPIVSAIQELDQQLTDLANTMAGFAQSFTTHILTGDDVTANNELCVGSTCVTPVQFQAMVAAADASQSSGQGSGSSQSAPVATSSAASATPPVLQVNGDNPAIIQVGESYNDLGATITGPQQDLNLGLMTFVNGVEMSPVQIDTSTAATDTIDYVATDQNGLTSTSTRNVIIEAPANDNQATSIPANDNSPPLAATSTSATTTSQ